MIPNAWQGFDFGLGEDIDMLRDTTRSFSDDKIAPRADEIDKTNTFPRDLWPQMGALGLHGITVEEEYGGSGMGYLAHCVAMEEISRGSASVGLSYGAHSNLCVNQIRRTGTDAQRRNRVIVHDAEELVGCHVPHQHEAGEVTAKFKSLATVADRLGNVGSVNAQGDHTLAGDGACGDV